MFAFATNLASPAFAPYSISWINASEANVTRDSILLITNWVSRPPWNLSQSRN